MKRVPEKTVKTSDIEGSVKKAFDAFLAGTPNDQDEIGTASAWKYNLKGLANLEDDARVRSRSFLDELASQRLQMGTMLMHWFNQSAFNADMAGKNLVFNTNLTHKNALFDSSVAADEQLKTSEEQFVDMLVAQVIKQMSEDGYVIVEE